MCGIIGIKSTNSTPSLESGKNMLSMIKHRGPDEFGLFKDSQVLLGSARLSIVDLVSGQQPLSSENGRYWIAYNGEVYNHDELRDELKEKYSCHFKTRSDTEVIVNLYQFEGESFLNKLDGQFAFAIWDKLEKKLFLARDRVGISPLYYHQDGNQFSFASEMKALFALPTIAPQFRWEALLEISTLWTTLPPNTHFKNISELAPGNFLTVDQSGRIQTKCYWDLPVETDPKKIDTPEAIEITQSFLNEAVKKRLKADVEVGTYLSGGLDSSIITLLAQRHSASKVKTFSVGFEDPQFDEQGYQKQIADFLGTDHHTLVCNKNSIQDNFLKAQWHSEKIMFRTAPIPLMLLSEQVKKTGLKVILTGEGADEIFYGYDIFKEAKLLAFWGKQPDSKIRPLLLRKLYPYLPQFDERYYSFQVAHYKKLLSQKSNFPYATHITRYEASNQLATFLSPDAFSLDTQSHYLNNLYDQNRRPSGLSQMKATQYWEMKTLLNGYLLSSQGDRMLMANSVEGRYPFLSHKLIEIISRMDDTIKMQGFNEKRLLKMSFAKDLPESVIKRRKQPYLAPDAKSFSLECDYIQHYFSQSNLDNVGYLDSAKIRQLSKKCLDNKKPALSFKDNFCFMTLLSTLAIVDMFTKQKILPRSDNLKNLKITDQSKS